MTSRLILAVTWLLLALPPLWWWLRNARRLDPWTVLPIPAALLAPDGTITDQTGPMPPGTFTPRTGLPPAGQVARTSTTDGTPLALTGLKGGGALAVILSTDPVGQRRDKVLAELGARLAHDINTPLAALVGHLDLIAHQPISDQAHASVRTCQRELTRLQTTAQDLLTFTRLRAGGGARSSQLAGALVEEATAALLDTADELQAVLTVQVPTERVLVDVAEADLVRALRNLILNSLRHGLGTERTVLVSVTATPDTVTFAVADSGPGLNPEQLAELSQPLARGHADAPGSGLGLAIVAEVLTGHGTHLSTSRDDQDRPQLTFTLPRLA